MAVFYLVVPRYSVACLPAYFILSRLVRFLCLCSLYKCVYIHSGLLFRPQWLVLTSIWGFLIRSNGFFSFLSYSKSRNGFNCLLFIHSNFFFWLSLIFVSCRNKHQNRASFGDFLSVCYIFFSFLFFCRFAKLILYSVFVLLILCLMIFHFARLTNDCFFPFLSFLYCFICWGLWEIHFCLFLYVSFCRKIKTRRISHLEI